MAAALFLLTHHKTTKRLGCGNQVDRGAPIRKPKRERRERYFAEGIGDELVGQLCGSRN
jgi:hypothetical protein